MTLSEYSHLKQQVLLNVNKSEKHNEVLHSLKEIFKDNINSVRRLEQINSVGQLLQVLEYRDVLSEDDVEPLKDIVRKLSNGIELIRMISEYEEFHMPKKTSQHNDFHHYSKKDNYNSSSHKPLSNHPIMGNISSMKRQRIFETITEELGTYWRNLARYLDIKEGTIIEIENYNIPLSGKVLKLLEIYEHRADPQRWFFILCDALEKADRRDIADSLRNIMGMNI